MGLEDYLIYGIDSKNGQGLIIDAKSNYQAVTMYNYLVPFKMWIGNVTMVGLAFGVKIRKIGF